MTAREFFREPYKYLKQLPVVVTVRNMNRYVVTEYENRPSPSVPVITDVVTDKGEVTKNVIASQPVEKSPSNNIVGNPIYHGTWLCKKHQSFMCSCKQPT